MAIGLVVAGMITSCGTLPPDDRGPSADAAEPTAAAEQGDAEADAALPPPEDAASPAETGGAEPAAGPSLEATLVTEADLAGRLGPEPAGRWTARREQGDLQAFDDVIAHCGPAYEWSLEQQEAWETFMEDLDRDRPPPFAATSRAAFVVDEYWLVLEHAVGEVSSGSAADHVERIDTIGSSCPAWDAAAFESQLEADLLEEAPLDELAAEDALGVVERLEVPPLGDGSTAWRYVFFVPESLPFYVDHVLWHRDGVISTVTFTWSPTLLAGYAMIGEQERQALAQLGDLAIRLDERLAAVLAAG